MAACTVGCNSNIILGVGGTLLFRLLLLSSLLLHNSSLLPLHASAARTHHPASERTHHAAQVSSLLPPSVCNKPSTTTRGLKVGGALDVVHKHGPCSQTTSKDKVDNSTLAQILAQDQLRVDSIQSILSKGGARSTVSDSRTTIQAVSGRPLGTGNFVVNVSLGTPNQILTLAFDTASALTWTQCLPCAKGGCYTQYDPIFDPTKSGTYGCVGCSDSKCSDIAGSTSFPPGCSSGNCAYGIQYGDGSTTHGILSVEKLSLTATDSVDSFLFGCGQNNTGLYGETAGILGLSQDKVSLVSQAAHKFDRVFSYCLPTTGSVGSLTFGSGGINGSSPIAYTPLSPGKENKSGYYYLDLIGIDVGGKPVPISAAKQSHSHKKETIIDSGTVVTRLSPADYAALKSAFKNKMTNYTLTEPFGIFDTCYDFSKFDTVTIPTVRLNFKKGAAVVVDALGTIIGPSIDQLCLAFAGNQEEDDVAIIGNLQQVTYDVVYDVGRQQVGFGAGGCG